MPEKPPAEPPVDLDLSPYQGCWVAIVRDGVCGIGRTAEAARRAARQNRPREEPKVLFVRDAPPPS